MGARHLLFIAGLWALLGCAPSVHAPAGASSIRERWLPSFVFGLFGDTAVDVRDVCPSGVASAVSVGSNAGTVAVTVLTLGVYAPRKVWVACAPEPKR